jgi:hypothetical protein
MVGRLSTTVIDPKGDGACQEPPKIRGSLLSRPAEMALGIRSRKCYSKSKSCLVRVVYPPEAEAIVNSLDCDSSSVIVTELIKVLGEPSVLEILGVSSVRLKALAEGRGRLKDDQLARIGDQTGKSWMRWGVDPIARGPRTADQKMLDAATYELLDKIDPIQGRSPRMNRRTKAPTKSPLYRASKFGQKQAS